MLQPPECKGFSRASRLRHINISNELCARTPWWNIDLCTGIEITAAILDVLAILTLSVTTNTLTYNYLHFFSHLVYSINLASKNSRHPYMYKKFIQRLSWQNLINMHWIMSSILEANFSVYPFRSQYIMRWAIYIMECQADLHCKLYCIQQGKNVWSTTHCVEFILLHLHSDLTVHSHLIVQMARETSMWYISTQISKLKHYKHYQNQII